MTNDQVLNVVDVEVELISSHYHILNINILIEVELDYKN